MRNEVQRILSARPIDLHGFRALDDDPPAWVKNSARRNLSKARAGYEKKVRARQLSGVEQATEQALEQQANIRSRLIEADARVTQIAKAVKAGRMDPGEAEREVAQIIRAVHQDRQALDHVDQTIERIRDVADQDPADWLGEVNSRFPSTTRALPVITAEWLMGMDDSDPLEGLR